MAEYRQINYDQELFKDQSSGTTLFPDNVRPINTYGDIYMVKSYRPFAEKSLILVEVFASFDTTTACAIFKDSNLYSEGAGQTLHKCNYFNVEIENYTGHKFTLYLRAGQVYDVGGTKFNVKLNGETASSMIISEYIKIWLKEIWHISEIAG